MGCLYAITAPNGKKYIGISVKTAASRWAKHCEHAAGKRPGALYAAIRKYGAESFVVAMMLVADDWDYLCDMERRAIAAFGTFAPGGYNMTYGGEGTVGPRDEETRRRISVAQKKRFERPEERAKAAEHLRQGASKIDRAKHAETMRSPVMRARLSAAAIRQFSDPEQRAAARERTLEIHRARPELREEHTARMALWRSDPDNKEAHRVAVREAMNRPETKKKLRAEAQRRAADPEWRAKVSASKTGKTTGPCSDERKQRIAAARRREWQDPVIRVRRLAALAKAREAKAARHREQK